MDTSEAQRVIKVTLPNGEVRTFPAGVTIREVAAGITERLGRECLGAMLDGADEILDLRTPLERDCSINVVTARDEEGLEVIRHSAAHVMADAVLALWPDTKLAIGPAIEDGFYYDLDLEHRLTPEDLPRIEEKMAEIIKQDTPLERCVVDRDEVLAKAKAAEDTYKAEMIEDFPADETVTYFRHGEGRFEDLCRGPHVPSTGHIKAVKLLNIAGSYWRGDEKRPMLQRIYGTAWASRKQLKEYLHRIEEAKKRDHRKLGRELGLFLFDPVAPASPFFLPKGTIVYNLLVEHMRGLYRRFGYQEVLTPQIFDVELWHRSGHYDHYRDNMFFTNFDDAEYAVKPMNCPSHTFIYAAEKRSYRDLPLRIADFGRLHRYERSGVTSGLTRVRTFAQDDAHIFCTPEQINAEITDVIVLIQEVYKTFGFEEVRVMLSTRPESSVGSDEIWERAEASLREALASSGLDYTVNEGDGAFYGPKIDFEVLDALKRTWQLATVQLDFSMPERFGLRFTDRDGVEKTPVMVHRAVLGSLERFMGILIEHTAGLFPFWLAPVQARVLTITDGQDEYASGVMQRLHDQGWRVEADLSNQKIGAKIRHARLQRIPFLLICGDKEVAAHTVAVREHPDHDLGAMSPEKVSELFAERQRSLAR